MHFADISSSNVNLVQVFEASRASNLNRDWTHFPSIRATIQRIICLETISSTLRDLLLQRNDFDTTTFSHTSHLFDGVRHITGKLDLQYSRFQMGTQLTGNCLFDLFNEITALDLSHVEFLSIANDTDVHLKHLLKCKASTDRPRQGEQLLDLFLRQLNLQSLPDWLTYDRFPRLAQLDLSHNNIHTIDLSAFTNLYRISLAFNPLELHDIGWRANTVYKSINLRSTIQNRNFNLTANLENLFKITTNIDYSGNMGSSSFSLAKFPVAIDFPLDGLSLNISHMNISSFDTKGFSQFDDLARLDISANQLIALNLEQQGKLAYLDCSNQNLTSLTLNGDHSDLVELRCARNQLATIENFSLHKHETLKSIDLSYNAVESLESFFSNTNSRHLHSVRFQSNVIKKIPAKTFHPKLISLYLIDLSWNQINSIERAAIQSPNLQILDLTGNPLKSIEPNFLFTASLRLFFIVNSSQELIDRCAQSTSDDTLLVNYMTWYEQNGTHMNSNPRQRAEEIQFDKCLRRYTSRSKVKWTKLSDGHQIKHWSLYVTMAAISTGIVLGTIYLYRKHKLAQQTSLQRYRPLNSHTLVENADDCQPEDDEIVLNLNESPFRTIH